MAIKNILLRVTFLNYFFLSACQTTPIKQVAVSGKRGDVVNRPSEISVADGGQVVSEAPPIQPPNVDPSKVSKQKVAVIFGPAGFGSFAYAGFLEELQREKLNVVAVEGIEWGALLAAFYSRKPLPFEAQWQVLKLKTDSRIEKYLKDVFGAAKVEDSPLGFACPAYDLARKKAFLLHKGYYSELLLYCMPTLPLMPAYRNTVAHLNELDSLIEYANSKGAGKIIYVQAEPAAGEPAFDPAENSANAFWLLSLDALRAKAKEPIETCTIPLAKNFSDFGDRQRMITIGKEKAIECLKRMKP